MTRRECEDKILDLLKEVQKVYAEYAPDDEHGPCTCVGKSNISTFAFNYDENDTPINGSYTLSATEYADGERSYT